jgi:hypothetical protein
VDVLLTMTDVGQDPSGGGTTITLLQNVEILAVDSRVEAPAENKVDANQLRSVTLLVTPDQAVNLNLGQDKGTLHLSLRHPNDSEVARTQPATLKQLRVQQEELWNARLHWLMDTGSKLLVQLQRKSDSQRILPVAGQGNLPLLPVHRKEDWETTIQRGLAPQESVKFYRQQDGSFVREYPESKPDSSKEERKPGGK